MDCPKCGGEMHRTPDVLDVWFDSSIAAWATLGFPKDEKKLEDLWPSNFITEGEIRSRSGFMVSKLLQRLLLKIFLTERL